MTDNKKKRARQRRYYRANREKILESQRKYNKSSKAAARRKKYNSSEKGRERDKRYKRSYKGRLTNKRKNKKYREKKRLENLRLVADVPAFIVTPYGRQLYTDITGYPPHPPKGSTSYPQSKKVAESIGVNYHQFSNILKGEKIRVSIDTIDAICMRLDVHIDEVYDDMNKYAEEHPELNWPESFKPNRYNNKVRSR